MKHSEICSFPRWRGKARMGVVAGLNNHPHPNPPPPAGEGIAVQHTLLEPVFTICIGRFDGIKARIQGKKHSKVGHLARIFNAVAAFLGH